MVEHHLKQYGKKIDVMIKFLNVLKSEKIIIEYRWKAIWVEIRIVKTDLT